MMLSPSGMASGGTCRGFVLSRVAFAFGHWLRVVSAPLHILDRSLSPMALAFLSDLLSLGWLGFSIAVLSPTFTSWHSSARRAFLLTFPSFLFFLSVLVRGF